MSLPNLTALTRRSLHEIPVGDRLTDVLLAIGETVDDPETDYRVILALIHELPDLTNEELTTMALETDFGKIFALIHKLPNLTNEELTTIAHHINNRGIKPLGLLFMLMYPEALSPSELRRNATHRWWMHRWDMPMRRWDMPNRPLLNFKMDEEGFVVVDLWHTRRGNVGPASFKEFAPAYPTFFFGFYGLVRDNLDSLQDYVEEAEDGEDSNLYVKRGRFKFKPLLWFGDKKIKTLRDDPPKANIVARLVNSHPVLVNDSFDLQQQDDAVWKRMLYYRYEVVDRRKYAMPLRLDNNCVEDASIPLEAGYLGTLVVDVSGFGGATAPPGSVEPESQSVVIWDVPNALVEEDPWEQLIL